MTDRFPELSETFVTAEIDSLRRAGLHVRVEARSRGNGSRPEMEASYLADDGRAQRLAALLYLSLKHPLRVASDLLNRRRWRRTEETVPLRVLASCARRVLDDGATHIHVHFADRAALDALRIAQILGVPWSLTAHAYDIFMSPRNLEEKMTNAAFVTSGCRYNVDYLRSLVATEARDRIHEVIMGVDGHRLRRRQPYRDSGTVLAVGRLVEKKGFRYLVEAVALLKDRTRLRQAIIVGSGPLESELRRLVDDLSLSDYVQFVGPRTPSEIRDLLEDAEIFAMPCVVAGDGDRDSMPVVVKEAMAMQVPIVASNEVGLPELVSPAWGKLVPPHDSETLAQAIEELLTLPRSQRVEMGHAARAHVLAAANVDRETEIVIQLIRAAQQSRRHPTAGR